MRELLTKRFGDRFFVDALDDWRAVVWKQDNYVPTPMQADYMFQDINFKLVAGGVRAGKSKSASRSMDWYCAIDNGLIWIIGPDYNKAAVEFKYMLKPYAEMGLIEEISDPNKDAPKMFKLKGGARVETKSAMDPVKLSSYAPDAILVVEAGACPSEVVDKALERGIEKDAYVVLSGTFEGAFNWYSDLFTELQSEDNKFQGRSYSLPTWSNNIVFPGGRNDPKIKRLEAAVTEEIFLERCAAVPYRPAGLVFREFDPKLHVAKLDVDPSIPVELAVDPGLHTYAVLFVQRYGDYVHVLDEVYRHNVITQDIIPEVMANPLWQYVRGGVMDQAGSQRQANKSVAQVWQEMTGISFRWQYVEIQQNIDAVKLRLKVGDDDLPRVLFNNTLSFQRAKDGRAGGILSEFQMWQWPQTRTVNQNARRVPVDKNNDALKALGYYLFSTYGPVVERKKASQPKRKAVWRMKQVA